MWWLARKGWEIRVIPEPTFYSMNSFFFFSFTVCIYLLEGCYFHNVNEQCYRGLLYKETFLWFGNCKIDVKAS